MVGVDRLIVFYIVAFGTYSCCATIARTMTFSASCGNMCPGQWKCCLAVVKCSFTLPCRMAGIASLRSICISTYACMFTVCFGLIMRMAVNTAEKCIVVRTCMTFHTVLPFALMTTAVNRKILEVMVESSWSPGILTMTLFTTGRKLYCLMWWICGLVVSIRMAAKTSVGTIDIITFVTVKTVAGNALVRPGQWIVVIVLRKAGRLPVGICCVA
mgnify:CR=1 FL=1